MTGTKLPTLLALACLTLLRPALAQAAAAATENKLVIHVGQARYTISRNLYGQFSEHLGRGIYEGLWVGEESPIPNTRGIRNDVVAALKQIKVPVLRWPGGCFADEYHWQDGIGPRAQRPTIINTYWGGVVENNHFGTHEFMDLCEQIGCEPYIGGNVGSGTVRELEQWVEYLTFPGRSPMAETRKRNGREQPWKVRYLGIGNENWACGGSMTPEYYADQFKRYTTYVHNFGANQVFKVACGPNAADTHWTDVLMREVGRRMDGLSLHYYCGSSRKASPATVFDQADWCYQLKNALRMEDLITRHSAIMDKYDPEKRIALVVDEWGAWHAVEPGTNPGFLYQQNTLRDALVAGCTLNIFNNHCDRVRMANIAQMVNVLQAMILTDHDKMLLTPTWHVFALYTAHHDATLLPTDLQAADCPSATDKLPQLSVSASKDPAGRIHVTLCNLDPEVAAKVACQLDGAHAQKLSGRVLTAAAMNAHNTFALPDAVKTADFTACKLTSDGFTAELPAKSVVLLEAE